MVVDEERLRATLSEAAESFDIPDMAVEQVLLRARDLDASPHLMSRFRRRKGETVASDAHGDAASEDEALKARWRRRMLQLKRPPVVLTTAALSLVAVTLILLATLGGLPSSQSNPSANRAPQGLHSSATPGAVSGGSAAPGSAGGVGASGGPAPAPGSSSPPATAPSLPTGAVGQSSKVEETGSLDLTIGKGRLETILTSLTNLAVADGGFAADTATQSGDASNIPTSGSITLQVPQASFDNVLANAQALGTVTSVTSKATDVTGQYVDLQARITALQASRDQYLTIMSKATSISDILAVENQLDSIQSQLDQLQGQLQVLDNETSYATLAVSLTENRSHRPPPSPKPASGISDAWHRSVSGFAAAFDGLVRIAGPALFVLLCLMVAIILGRLAWRSARRRFL
ncbi:MAG TPA: DUF4349 domain-containing protein [Acidimicrobiales bacterium]|nr:DUF4349 domain-containing protein [Acidimicrobiales bacterium]